MKEGLEKALEILSEIKSKYENDRYSYIGNAKAKLVIDSKLRAIKFAKDRIVKELKKNTNKQQKILL